MGAQATQELFKDGLVCTGDIMEQREANKLVWIDRRKNIMKLAQGEYVSVSRLEQDYIGSSPLIHQMFIYGSGLRSYLLAVVVPSPGALLAERNAGLQLESHCESSRLIVGLGAGKMHILISITTLKTPLLGRKLEIPFPSAG